MSERDELDKTIEELEAEILAELEEANGQDAPKKSATPAEKAEKMDNEKTPGGEVVDTGKPVVDPEQKDAPAKKSAAKAKEIGGQAPQKSEGKPEKPEKLAAGDELDHDGEELGEDKALRTKSDHLEAFGKMTATEVKNMYASYQKGLDEAGKAEEEAELRRLEDTKAEIEEKIKSINVKEDVAALVSGEGLSEEFQEKAATIFEAAVKSKIRSEIVRMEEDYRKQLEESIEEQ